MNEALAPASNAYGLTAFLSQTDAVGLIVIGLLLAMSVASWYYIASKLLEQLSLRRAAASTPEAFWAAKDLAEAEQVAQSLDSDPFAALALAGVDAARQHAASTRTLGSACDLSDFVTRALRQSIVATTSRLESGQTLLASVGSTAPFVGLFGTVWGIYHALVAISLSGQGSLDKVAGPVGEALIMTAAGLAVAIPAVLAYNTFVRANRLLLAQLDGFAHDVHAALAVGSHLRAAEITSHAAGALQPASRSV
jgi:biopolymer transport protein ExbB